MGHTLAAIYFLFKLSQACCLLARGDQAGPGALGREQPCYRSPFLVSGANTLTRGPAAGWQDRRVGSRQGGAGWELSSPDVAWGAVWTLCASQWLPVACVVKVGLKGPPGPAVSGSTGTVHTRGQV